MLQHPRYESLYNPKLRTPIFHSIGAYDPMIPEGDTMKVIQRCENHIAVYHPGSHYVPKIKYMQAAMLDFVKRSVGLDEENTLSSGSSVPSMFEGSV